MFNRWKPTNKQYSTYLELLKQYNKIREKVTKVHRNLEQYTPSHRMPSLVVPQRQRKLTVRQFQIRGKTLYRGLVKFLRANVKHGLKGLYKDYKNSYLELYRSYLIKEDPSIGGFYSNLYYSQDQIENADESIKLLMHAYNKLVRIDPYVFAYLMMSGRIPAFKQLYNEFNQDFEVSESFSAQLYGTLRYAHLVDSKKALEVIEGVNRKDLRRRISYVEGDIQKGLQTIINKRR